MTDSQPADARPAHEPPPLDALERELLARAGRGAKLGLGPVRRALAQLGAPHNRLRVAHVAGTNGKGSTCAMLASIARAAGMTVGLSTSPHLEQLAERIRLNGAIIDEERLRPALAAALDERLPRLSFFEAITVAAMVAMDREAVELAVMEVGLGGRLDASNVFAAPQVVAVTSIARDHTAILGDRLDAIAREKIAIARRGRPVVLGPLPEPANETIAAYCSRVGVSQVWQVARDDAEASRNQRRFGHAAIRRESHGEQLHINFPRGPAIVTTPGLAGAHQHDNAAVAAAMALHLGDGRIDADALAEGLAQAHWPGRLERFEHQGVTVWLDCAHNAHAIAALCRTLQTRPRQGRRALLFGAMADKRWPGMLDALAQLTDARFYCPPLPAIAGRRPVAPKTLAAHLAGAAYDDPEQALSAALDALDAGDELLIAGSAYLAGAARAWLNGRRRRLAIPL